MTIYHIITKPAWEEARKNGVYRPASLETEGFIHASMKEQVVPTANRRFSGRTDLLVLVINTDKIDHKIVFEESPTTGEKYPHIYGSLSTDAVEKVLALKSGQNGFELS